MLADLLVLVGLEAGLVERLGLRRAALQQPHGAEDVERELQVLRLPVLGDVGRELRGRQVAPEGDRVAVVQELVVVEGPVAGDGLAGEAGRKMARKKIERLLSRTKRIVRLLVVQQADGDEVAEPRDDEHQVGDEHRAHQDCSSQSAGLS